MKSTNVLKIGILSILFSMVLFSCEKQAASYENGASEVSTEMKSDEAVVSDSTSITSSSAATYQDKNRQFKRTVDVSMEVKDVYKSTIALEKSIADLGGFITTSHLTNIQGEKEIFPISSDSAKEVTKYHLENQMTARIPQNKLGSFLHSLGSQFTVLFHRKIEAEDVSLDFKYSELENKTQNEINSKLNKTLNKGGKITDESDVIERIQENETQKNTNTVSKLKLKDEVNFSTISILITEKEKAQVQNVVNWSSYTQSYSPDLAFRMKEGLFSGYVILENILVFIIHSWSVILILIGLFFLYKKLFRKPEQTIKK